MKGWFGFMHLIVYVAIGGVLLTVTVWSVFPFAFVLVAPVWLIPLFLYMSVAVGLIGLAAVGISRLARYFAKPS